MPANNKYLNQSAGHRFAKVSAGIIGGYAITALLHMSLALWLPNSKEVLISSIFSFFMVWCALLIIPFLYRNGWRSWLLYICLIVLLFVVYFLGQKTNPFL